MLNEVKSLKGEDDSHIERVKRIWQAKLAPEKQSRYWSNNVIFEQIT